MNIIDISEWQGIVDFDKVKADGVEGIIIRIGWIDRPGRHGLDSKFERNYSECRKRNIPIGGYVYNYCRDEESIRSGADWVLTQIKNKTFDLPIYLDMEDSSIASLGKDKLTHYCIVFNTIIESSGNWAGVYANLNWFNNYLDKVTIKSKYTTWAAHWDVDPMSECGNYDMLQFTDRGQINGISGNVDLDILYRDIIGERQGSSGSKPQKSIDELAQEVIRGYWGNDNDRKNRLTASGYNYDQIQNRVNEILLQDKRDSHIYEVQKGDTLSDIANKYGVPYQDIAEANGISNPNLIYPGQQLVINGAKNSNNKYIIQPGDTLSEIAAKNGTTVEKLAAKNGIKDPNRIYAGDVLNV